MRIASCLLVLAALSGPLTAADEAVLVNLTKTEGLDVQLDAGNVDSGPGDIATLRIPAGGHSPGVRIAPRQGAWDASAHQRVSCRIRNAGEQAVRVELRLHNAAVDARKPSSAGDAATIEPGKTADLAIRLHPTPWRVIGHVELVGMRAAPGMPGPIDPAAITEVSIRVTQPKAPVRLEIAPIRLEGEVHATQAKDFFPFIDTFGQFRHGTWPGKTASIEQMAQRAAAEAKDLAAHPGPEGWNQWGGWQKGPRLKATGAFRLEKVDGQWWFVDPDGRLFWSQGIDCVGSGTGTTPITGREHYFADLPGKDSPLAAFYGASKWAPQGHYRGRGEYRTFSFQKANLYRKYGPVWAETFTDLSHRRLRSWGQNTIGNWSDPAIYGQQKTPYCVAVHFGSPPIEASTGYWGKFPDVYDPGFRAGLREAMARQQKTVADPWCIGYFVGNELSWGQGATLALAALSSPAEQPARKQLVTDLKGKYKTIEALNQAWQTQLASWEALAGGTVELTDVQKKAAGTDCQAFYAKMADEYFRICSEEVKRAAPGRLYLGCRFAWTNETAIRACGKHADLISFNFYNETVGHVKLPEGMDMPILSGEYHFGALDRGMFHTGLRGAASQAERARKYTAYVDSALRHPLMVGAHWFTYADQATTGRGDGENYQIGFLDIADTAYDEMVAAARAVGARLYATRLAAGR